MEISKYLTNPEVQHFLEKLSHIFTATLFQLGSIKISLSFVTNLAVQSVFVFLIARTIKQVFKNKILNRFGLAVGTREALSSIINYTIITVGLLVVLQNVGINFETLAVVLGAIGFCLAFGLQGLASDLAGGITLLLEQPIRVGDFIEVEDLAGTVENISIRSTIIRTPQGTAIVLPNNNIMTKNVVNWNYQATKSCIEIPISVLRDHDSLIVTEALLSVARKEPRVLSSPSPKVHLKGIDGDSLNFALLVCIEKPVEVDSIKSSLYFLVEAEFRERGLSDRNINDTRAIAESDNLAALSSLIRQLQAVGAKNGSTSDDSIHSSTLTVTKDLQLGTSKAVSKYSSPSTLRDLLCRVSYFEHLSDIEFRHIIEEGYRKTLKVNEVICRENDPGDSFYIILSGSVEVFIESINKQIVVRQPGEFIGEMSLLMGTPRTATLRTLEETTLFVVDRSNLQNLLKKHQGLADKISEELSKRQETLERLGIKLDNANKEETPFIQIRKRIQAIFGI
jgi:potassium efflux system protein